MKSKVGSYSAALQRRHFRGSLVHCRCQRQFLEQELPPSRVALQVSLQSSYTYCPRLLIGIHLCSGTEKVLVRGQARSCSTIPGYALPAREFLRDRNCRLAAHPKRHLATVRSVKNVSLDAGSGLTGRGNPVRSRFHELGEIVHRLLPYSQLNPPSAHRTCLFLVAGTFAKSRERKIITRATDKVLQID